METEKERKKENIEKKRNPSYYIAIKIIHLTRRFIDFFKKDI